MGCWYSTCMLTSLPLVGGEPAYIQFLRPAPDNPYFCRLAGRLFTPLGPLLPGTCNAYGGVDPEPDSPLWAWQVREWRTLLTEGRLKLDEFILDEMRGAPDGPDSVKTWAWHMQWACVRDSDISFAACDSETDPFSSPARESPETVTTQPNYAVLWRPAADAVAARSTGHLPPDDDVRIKCVTWTHGSEFLVMFSNHVLGRGPALKVDEADRQMLLAAAVTQARVTAGMALTRRSWLPSTLQSGAQTLEWAAHAELLSLALSHAVLADERSRRDVLPEQP